MIKQFTFCYCNLQKATLKYKNAVFDQEEALNPYLNYASSVILVIVSIT